MTKFLAMLLYILMLQIGIPISRNLIFELCYSEYFSKSPPPFYVRKNACLKRDFFFFAFSGNIVISPTRSADSVIRCDV
jgi:hypothetical protein